MKNFNYNETVILVGGSKVSLKLLKPISHLHPIFAADSGANILVSEKIDFKAVIGDMDSIDKKILKNPDIENIPIADQNSTDLEKCFSQVSAEVFIGFGFLDLRLDHSLASLTAICKNNSAKAIILVGELDTVIWVKGEWSCNMPVGTRLSIWPLSNQIFLDSFGLKYSLKNLKMDPVSLIGTSNETNKDSFSIIPNCDYPSKYVTIIPTRYFMNIYNKFTVKKL
tara:strand:- start:34 stop:708 length:675 start_codon:yes stop_codon:yes gene_type:complete